MFRNPFPHLLLEKALADPDRLKAAVEKQQFTRKDADLFSFLQSKELADDPGIQGLTELLRSKRFQKQLEQQFKVKLNGKIDAAAFIYEAGDYLLCHDDGVSSRRIAYIYYVNSLSAKQGGALALFSSKGNAPYKIAKRIRPKANTLLLFPVTRRSHHQVEEVLSGARITVTGWLHG